MALVQCINGINQNLADVKIHKNVPLVQCLNGISQHLADAKIRKNVP